MKTNNKYSVAAGIVIFVLAALFSVCLLLVAVDFGGMSAAHSSFFYLAGKVLVRAYGFSSVCIPIFLIVAGLQCFSSNWSLRNGIVLAGSVIPFFTLDAVEHIIRMLAKSETGSVMNVKIGASVLIGAMLISAEFILLMILGEVAANKLKRNRTGNEESVFDDDSENLDDEENLSDSDDFENHDDENEAQNDAVVLENGEENLGLPEDESKKEEKNSPSKDEKNSENQKSENGEDSKNQNQDEPAFDFKTDKIFNEQKKVLKDLITVGKSDEEKRKFENELSESEKKENEVSANLTDAERKALNAAIAEEQKKFDEEHDSNGKEKFSFELPEPKPQVFEDENSSEPTLSEDTFAESENPENENEFLEPEITENEPPVDEETFVEEQIPVSDEELEEPKVYEESENANDSNPETDTADYEKVDEIFTQMDDDAAKNPVIKEKNVADAKIAENSVSQKAEPEKVPEVDPTSSPVVDANGNPIEKEENSKPEKSENDDDGFVSLPDDFFDDKDDEDLSLNNVEGIDDNEDFKLTMEDSEKPETKSSDENQNEFEEPGIKVPENSERPKNESENEKNSDFEEPVPNFADSNENQENDDFEEPEFDETEFDGNENQESSDEEKSEDSENPNDGFELPENEDENSDELNLDGLDFENDSENPDENQNSDEDESNQETPNDEFEIPDFTDDDEDSDENAEDDELEENDDSENDEFELPENDDDEESDSDEDEDDENEADSDDENSDENENIGNSSDQISSAPLAEKRGLLEKAQAFNDAKKLSDAEKKAGITPDDDPYDRAKKLRIASYHISSELLNKYESGQYWIIDDETKQAGEYLTKTLKEFGIEAQVTGIRKGPVVTMFELLPAPGVKLSKIVSLQDNIALALAASSVRIVAPIPGKHAVGIEIPNKKRAVVSFREIIEMDLPEFKKMQIPVILGKDIQGEPHVIDLTKTPHLLIAGSTGSGKSVCVNSMILSILYKRSPEQVKLVLIDPKVVELKLYNDIPHLLTPVITEPKRALQALQYCLCEMERRYACLDGMGVRDIVSYNRKIVEKHIATEKLPYIVVIIDEFADLMATTGKELESCVARLAAMSRAVGIHLVLATQRPSVNVITGLIKANIPSRIAFMVASRQDSQIIIDGIGAEKLLGKGDMLYSSATDPFPTRIQGTLVGDDEVERVVNAVKQYGEPEYIDDEIFVDDDEEESEGPGIFSDGEDPLYDQALQIVIQAGKASASYIQRRLKIGYNRAARLVEEMEARGIVGPQNGSKPREVIHVPS